MVVTARSSSIVCRLLSRWRCFMDVTKHNLFIFYNTSKSIDICHGCHKTQSYRFLGNSKLLFPFFDIVGNKLLCKRIYTYIELNIFQNIFLDPLRAHPVNASFPFLSVFFYKFCSLSCYVYLNLKFYVALIIT